MDVENKKLSMFLDGEDVDHRLLPSIPPPVTAPVRHTTHQGKLPN